MNCDGSIDYLEFNYHMRAVSEEKKNYKKNKFLLKKLI